MKTLFPRNSVWCCILLLSINGFAQRKGLPSDSVAIRDSISKFVYQATLLSMDALQSKYESERTSDIGVKHQKSAESQNLFYQSRLVYRKALQLDPKNKQVWASMGTTYYLEGLSKEAVACFRNSIAIDPKNAAAWYNLGKTYDQMTKKDSAEYCYRHSIQSDSSYTQAYQELSKLIMTVRKDSSAAIGLLKRAAINSPMSEVPWVNMGSIYFQFGDSTRGVQCLEKAASVYSGDTDRLRLLCDYYARHKDPFKSALYHDMLAEELKKQEIPKDDEH